MVIYNGEELDTGLDASLERDTRESFPRRGFVYLGGGKVNLQLTAGDDERYGESFHFFRADQFAGGKSPRPIGYFPVSPPPFFSPSPPALSMAHPQTDASGGYLNPVPPFATHFTYYLKHLIYGYFTSDGSGLNMNNANQLSQTFSGALPDRYDARMRSSCLHLFGTSICPSPTLVLGEVFRRYVDYSSIILDATGLNGDGTVRRDALFGYVPEIPADSTLESQPFPRTIAAGKGGDLPVGAPIHLPDNVNWRSMFAADSQYQASRCRVQEEPYLRSHDFLCYRPDNGFFPTRSCFGSTDATVQETFSLSLHPTMNRSGAFFQRGALDELTYEDLAAKGVYRIRTFKEFLSRFVTDGCLILNAPVQVIGVPKEDYTLPPITVTRGGILLLDNGNLLLSAVRKDGNHPTEVLTIALGKGNIRVDTARSEGAVQAFLMAFQGSIRNETPTFPLQVRGGILERQHSCPDFPMGGKVEYNAVADPAGITYPTSYRVLVSDVEPGDASLDRENP